MLKKYITITKYKPGFIFRLFFLLFVSSFTFRASASVIHKKMYINRGVFTTVGRTTFPYIAFNDSASFDSLNPVIALTTHDTLILKVINHDSVTHGFHVQGYPGAQPYLIHKADSISDTLTFKTQGIYIYYDSYQYPRYRYLGEAGMICINNSTTSKKFYWNIKEHESGYNGKLAAGIPVNWAQYSPDYYTVNALSYPDLVEDTSRTWIHGNIGDTLHIALANTGQSAHPIHFHGFHCKVIYSANTEQIGRIKDTFPLKRMEAIIVELVPDKKGYYSIHDHNLMTNTGGGMHMRGIMSIMRVE
jgi:FtsP/CotA-like multicopper oxidase with cupredoxin domain